MPITVVWDDDDHSIVRYVYDGAWTWLDLRAAADQAVAMSRSVPHRVDILADLRRSGPLPVRNAIPVLKYMAEVSPPNMLIGIFVVVSGGIHVQALGNIFRRVHPSIGVRNFFVNTLEEAYALIEQDRARTVSDT